MPRAIYNDNFIRINLNELVAVRGEHLFKDDDVSMTDNQIDFIAEKLRKDLTWDTLYSMVDSSILQFYDVHEHPEVWTDKHYGEIQPEPGREKELNKLEAEANKRKAYFEKNFEMVELDGGSWTLDVPMRKNK